MVRKLLYSFLFFIFLQSTVLAQKIWNGNTNSDWNTASNWTGGIPNSTDAVQIPTVTIPATYPILTTGAICGSITFTGNSGTLTVNAGVTLSTGAVNIISSNTSSRSINIAGAGTLSSTSVTVGTTTAVPTQAITTVLISTISNFNITGDLTLNSRYSSNNNNARFNIESGTLDIDGQIKTVNQNSSNNSIFSMTTGAQSATLLLGNTTPFSLSGTGFNTISLNGTGGATVNYDRAGAQTVGNYPYYNLTLSNGGTKTFGAALAISNLLSVSTNTVAALGSFQHTAGILTLGGAGPLTSSWGHTSSNPVAVNTNNTFFANNTGRIAVAGAPYSAIDNNFASYGITGQVTGVRGENDGALTLTAPDGSVFINVKFASYGLPGGTSPNFTIGSCHAFNSRTVTTGLLGNTSATIPASGSFNDTFGDPCYGIVKNYYVVATYATPICSGTNPTVITGSNPTGGNGTYSFLWEVSTTSPTTGYSTAPGVNTGRDYAIPASPAITQKTWYRRTVTSGIYSDPTIVVISVNTNSEISAPTNATTSSASICSGTAVTLRAVGGSAGTIGGYAEWTTGSCSGPVVGTSALANGALTITPTASATYYVKYKNSCGSTTCASVAVTNPTSITLSGTSYSTCFNSTIAQNASVNYSGTTGTPTSFSIDWDAAANTAGIADRTNITNSFGATAGTITNAIVIAANTPPGTYTGILTVRTTTCMSFGNTLTVTVNPNNTITLSSGAGTNNQTKCINTALDNITFSTTGATGATFSGLPPGVSGAWASNVVTISGTSSVAGSFPYTVTLTGGCGAVTATGTITITPANTVTLSSGAGTNNQTKCINTALDNITFSTTGATGATFSGLPTGVSGGWASNVVTISGTSSVAGSFPYTVTLTGGCGAVTATGTITITPANTVKLSSGTGTNNQTKCINTALDNITFSTTGATGATFSGLPTGVSGAWASNVVTISGTSSVAGSFPYTVTLTGGCGAVTATGTITITPANTVTLSSGTGTNNQTKCINTALDNITFSTTGATGATFSGLPTGVSGGWASNVVTISGTSSVAGSFPYTVTLTGGCGAVTATGTITITPANTVKLSSGTGTNNQTKCINTALDNITFSTTGATGATFSGLPTGVSGAWASNVVTISGTSSVAGSFPYTVTLTGGCGAVTATGTITITPANTVTLSSGTGTNNQTKCINTALDNITFSTTGATGATFSGLPTGVSGAWASNVVTISGTSSVTGSFPYTVSLTGGCGTVTATGTIIIDVLPVITTQPHSLAICQGQNGSFNVVTTAATPTYQWQYSLSLSGPWTATNTATGVTGHNTATLSLTNVPNNYSNYYMRCIVTSNTCNTISDAVLLTVNPLPSTPTVSTTNVSCTATGSVTLGNLPASGTWTLERSPGLITTTGTGTTTTITGLAVGTYTFRVSNGTCSSAVSADAVITDQSSTTWNGSSWSPAAPDATRAAIIAGPFTVSADLTACSLTINSGIDIVVPSNFTLKIINGLTVSPTSKLTFENHSSLVQVNNNAVNSGKITYKRTAVQIRQADYTYWSTPVSPQRLIDVSPASSYNKFFGYSGTAWVATYPTGNMVVGKGYIIRGPDTFSNTAKADYTASFSGVPNNGILTGETMQADKFYLIGNPYPSALDADTFIDENRFLEGTLYFWTHNTPVVLSAAYRYSSTDYASYNLTGGVGSQPAPSGNPSNNDDKPSGFIGAGQSFFASAATPGTITFNNGMRLGATQNTQFFKSASKAAKIEKHRIWLNITNTEGAFKQMLVGYVQGASNEYEARYDGVSFDANPYIDFYSVANGNNYVIQARALPFANTDLVPLGYRTTIAGEFTIAIDQTDGDLKNQAIYLEDKTTGVIYDLTAGNYKFTTAKGTFSDRFVLRYTNKTLGTGDFEDTQNGLLVSVKQKNIKVTSAIENIKEVTIYDVAGKMLYNKNKAATTELQIQNLPSANQVLLVKITLENNFTTTKKIIFN